MISTVLQFTFVKNSRLMFMKDELYLLGITPR